MGEGRDYFKTNAIREKCTVGKSSLRAPFILTLRAEEWSGVEGRRVATSVSMTEEELCSRRQRKGRRGGGRRPRGRTGAARRRRSRPSAPMTDSKRVCVFSRLGSASRGGGKKAFHHFPLFRLFTPLPRARAPSERAPTRLSALARSLATRRWRRARARARRRSSAEWQAAWFSRLGG